MFEPEWCLVTALDAFVAMCGVSATGSSVESRRFTIGGFKKDPILFMCC